MIYFSSIIKLVWELVIIDMYNTVEQDTKTHFEVDVKCKKIQ